MLTLDAAVLAAFVAGIVSLIVSHFNNRSTRRSQEDEYQRRRREWFLEKQARDAEEIVASLERFSKQFSYHLGELDTWLFEVSCLFEIIDHDFSEEGEAAADHEKTRLVKRCQEFSPKIHDDMKAFERWVSYDVPRLTVWFEDFNQVDKELANLGDRFVALQRNLANFSVMSGRLPIKPDSTRQTLFDRASEKLFEIEREWTGLVADVAKTQRSLVNHLRINQR